MRFRFLPPKRFILLALTLVLVLSATVVWSDTGCNTVPYSRAYQSPNGDLGWCAGYYVLSCTYCWSSGGQGETCSTNLNYPCIAGPETQN
jgi:hypothetical protein